MMDASGNFMPHALWNKKEKIVEKGEELQCFANWVETQAEGPNGNYFDEPRIQQLQNNHIEALKTLDV